MVYVCLKKRAEPRGAPLVRDACDLSGDGAPAVGDVPLIAPGESGIYAVTPGDIARLVLARVPDAVLSFSGEPVCTVCVSDAGGARGLRRLPGAVRGALALLTLLAGSAMSIVWFHHDVGMDETLAALYASLSGGVPDSALYVAIPYAVGLGLGVLGYYGLLSGGRTASPLDVKLSECRAAEEETRAKRL